MSSLQILCCQAISFEIGKFPESILEDLNQPCLCLLVQHLCLIDLLKLSPFLKARDIPTEAVVNNVQRLQFKHVDAYPIKDATCPHLLNLFPRDSWDWALSRLLYRRLIVRMVEERSQCYKEGTVPSASELWNGIPDKHTDVFELFCPPSLTICPRVKEKILERWSQRMEQSLQIAAENIYYIIVDLSVCQLLMDCAYKHVLEKFCKSLKALSLLIKSSLEIVDFVRKMKERATHLERICIFAIKDEDMEYFDSILSVCSGVRNFYSTAEGQKMMKSVDALLSPTNEMKDCHRQDEDSTTESEEVDKPDFDLMDDAVLFSTPNQPSDDDSSSGMCKADFKVTNLVTKRLYVSVLSHHLDHWLALRELHLGVPELQPKITASVCSLIQRPQFKSFTLSSTDFKVNEIEEILVAVALYRKSSPMEKLMFVSVVTKWENVEDINLQDQLPGENDEAIDAFLAQYESQRLSKFSEFRGTNLLEWYSCSLGLRTECLIRQYLTKDRALTRVCFSNSLTRRFLTITLKTVTSLRMPLNQVIIEDWRVLSTEDCQILVGFLRSVSSTLESLNLSNCVLMRGYYSISDVWDALCECKKLKCLDLSANRLGDDLLPLVPKLMCQTDLRELSVRRNNMSNATTVRFLKNFSSLALPRGRMLDILDLRGNQFSEEDRRKNPGLLQDVAKYILLSSSQIEFMQG
ncbi:uncharacterized protein LOC101863080 [Aplysia californica]|uniref:Uncharacterized protein LOC101863080 n=1 Tax=Aplysia californica TaxID=6500 RepID=A0ABM0JEG0_APLCA|nr:uncharacterized protein LOC101863080 [Aplysia californica]